MNYRSALCCLLIFTLSFGGVCSAAESDNSRDKLNLTKAEKSWLAAHPVVRVRISKTYPPFEFFKDGGFQGISYDLLVLIGKQLGVEFRPTPDMLWKDALESIQKKEGVDLILMITRKESREWFIEFTKTYISYPQIIITRRDSRFISNIKDLSGGTVATENGFVQAEQIGQDVPGVTVIETPTTKTSLEAVATGKADAYVGNLAVASFLIEENGFANLKVAAPSSYPFDSYAMGVRKDWPELASILDKAITSFPEEERRKINQKWLSVRYEHGVRPLDILKWVLIVSSVLLIFIVQLRRMVRKRTGDLKHEIEARTLMEQELQSLFMAAPVGIAYVKDRVFQKVNDAMCRLYGYSREELIGHSSRKLYATEAEFKAAGSHAYTQAMEIGSAMIETRTVTKQGLHLDILLGIAPLVRGAVSAGFVTVVLDITQRKKAIVALKESEKRFQTIFDESPLIIALNDLPDGGYVDVNRKFCEWHGTTKEELLGKTSVEMGFISQEESLRIYEIFKNNGKIDNEEITTTDNHGKSSTSLLSTRIVEISGKSYSLSMLQDITAKKLVETALETSEKQYRNIFENSPIGIFQSLPGGRFISMNTAYAEIFGYSTADEMIADVTDIARQLYVNPRQRDDILMQLKTDDRVNVYDLEAKRKDGTHIFADLFMRSVSGVNGKIEMLEGFLVNVTERKKTEEIMILNEKMSMIAGMAAGIAHEVNNPLGAITQDLQNLERRFSSTLPGNRGVAEELGLDLDKMNEYMERRSITGFVTNMRGAAKRASTIIGSMLQFSRQSDLGHQDLDINEIIEQSLKLAANDYDLRKKYDFKNISIESTYGQDLPVVSVCLTEMEQVIINILKNAAQAMFDAGTAKPGITISTYLDEGNIVVAFADNGPGMPDAVRQHIFDPFFTTKAVGSGTGLGMSVSHTIITKNHGGTLTVDSKPGRGACFTIRLPLSRK
ncbi:MAG: PAS domain S-box protein [Desulfuromonadales bacterium]